MKFKCEHREAEMGLGNVSFDALADSRYQQSKYLQQVVELEDP